MKKICKKEIKKSLELIEFRVEKVITRKGDKLYVTRKDYNVLLTVGLIKKTVSISKSFPELKTSWERVKVELDLSNYATKSDLKNTASVDTSKLLKRLI